MDNVDIASERVRTSYDWEALNGLPLDYAATQLLQATGWFAQDPSTPAFAQTSLNQAITACALERHRIRKGGYPQTLRELMPDFLDHIPRDAVSGKPLLYDQAGGFFILRGVGPNEVADRNHIPSDDWLWMYPGATNAIPVNAKTH